MDDLYSTLNISPTAPEEEIRAALHREMRTWTQRESNASALEKRQEAERMIKLIDEAETILLDGKKRSDYDKRLEIFLQENGNGKSSSHASSEALNNLIEKATHLLRAGNYPPAISLLKRAVNLDPGNAMVERMLKDAKRDWGQYLLRNH
jgi:DnaJ-class molecular chaperone